MRAQFLTRHLMAEGVYWIALYGALWWLLAGVAGWGFGIVCIGAATALSLALRTPPWRVRIRALPGFLAFFLKELVVGGWDVAQRAFHPRLPLNPAWVTYSLVSPDPRVRLILSAMVGLLPGTLASECRDDLLLIHTLDQHQSWSATVARLENSLMQLLEEVH